MANNQTEDVLEQAAAWRAAGHGVAIATVVRTYGSSPRRVGSQLAANDESDFVGSVSGGCVESSVVSEAVAVIKSGEPRVLEFGVTNENAWEVGLACGGEIDIYVEALPERGHVLDQLLAERRAHNPVVLATDLTTGEQMLLRVGHGTQAADGDRDFDPSLWEAARNAAMRGRSGTVDGPDGPVFLNVYNPPLRMVIVGAVHIAQALVPMAKLAGFEVIIVDPREGFATEARFPDVELVLEWPDEALESLALDLQTAVVVLSHNSKLDDPAVATALRSDAVYIGALGSKKTQAGRKERLLQMGFSEDDLARVNGPIGLSIGSSSPAEIAVSTLAQVIKVVRTGEP